MKERERRRKRGGFFFLLVLFFLYFLNLGTSHVILAEKLTPILDGFFDPAPKKYILLDRNRERLKSEPDPQNLSQSTEDGI